MVRKEMVSLWNSLVCHADSLYQRQICVSETSDKVRITKKKSLCYAYFAPHFVSFSFSCIQRMNAVWYQKVYTNRQTYGVGNRVFHVMQMVCNASATINWLYELRPSSDVWKVTSCRVQFHANVGKRQLDWQGLLNQRMRTLPTCRTVAPHSVA